MDLANNGLVGSIPENLAAAARAGVAILPYLERLNLENNQLTGEIPKELAVLSGLKVLWLAGNEFSGEIPEELSSLVNLEEVSLSGGNQFTFCIPDVFFDARTTDVSRLNLQRCSVTERLPVEGDVYDTDGDGLIEISNLEQLYAIRHDPDGDGYVGADGAADYVAAFPTAFEEYVCQDCSGYELTRSLDFDSPDSYASGGSTRNGLRGWGGCPLGGSATSVGTTMAGNQHSMATATRYRTCTSTFLTTVTQAYSATFPLVPFTHLDW